MQKIENYLICSTQRTGSHFLASGLKRIDSLGNPGEFFVPHVRETFGDYSIEAFVELMQKKAKDSGVLFGAKLTWPALIQIHEEYEEVHRISLTKIDLLNKLFPNTKFIFLKRYDKVAQSISLYKAKLDNVWGETIQGEKYKRPGRIEAKLRFDYHLIKKEKEKIMRYESNWENFFKENGINPLIVYYEDCVSGYAKQLRRIVDFLQLNHSQDYHLVKSMNRKQSNLINKIWKIRYCLRACFEKGS